MNYGYWVFTVSLARAVRCCSRSASRCSWRWGRGWGRAAGTVCTANSLFQQIKHNELQWPPVHPDVVVPAEGGGDHAAMAGVGGGSGLQGQHTGPDQLMYIFCSDFRLMHYKAKVQTFYSEWKLIAKCSWELRLPGRVVAAGVCDLADLVLALVRADDLGIIQKYLISSEYPFPQRLRLLPSS